MSIWRKFYLKRILLLVGILAVIGGFWGGSKIYHHTNTGFEVVVMSLGHESSPAPTPIETNGVKKDTDGSDWISAVKHFSWPTGKAMIYFLAFVIFCHQFLGKYELFLFSIEDGKAAAIYSGDRIIAIKMTLYNHKMSKNGDVDYYSPSWIIKPFYWFWNYFFGGLHIKGIPGIHKTNRDPYQWERFDPLKGKAEKVEGQRGFLPLREFTPLMRFNNLDIGEGGQINVEGGPLMKVENPVKAFTNARDWFAVLNDLLQAGMKEFFSPQGIQKVFTSKGIADIKKMLSTEIYEYLRDTEAMPDSKRIMVKRGEITEEESKGKVTLLTYIEKHYGIDIIGFNVRSVDPANPSTSKLLDLISEPAKAKLEAEAEVNRAKGDADAFNLRREAMQQPGGLDLRTLQAIENSNLLVLGGGEKSPISLLLGDQPTKGRGGKKRKITEEKRGEKEKTETETTKTEEEEEE